ncbi:hypothetical protein ACTFIY_001254 [Dictyostelium cf. discoideum]
MGKFLTNYYNKVFNSPKNFDDISSKKTKNFLMLLCLLGIILWIIIIIVVVKDSLNRLTFMTNEIENQIIIPNLIFTFYKNISQYAINSPSGEVIPSDIEFLNGYFCRIPENSKIEYCNNTDALAIYKEFDPIRNDIFLKNINLTFEEEYFNINIGQDLKKYNESSGDDASFTTFGMNINNYNFFLNGPIDLQVMIKKTKRIDRHQKETINLIPNVLGAGEKSSTCPDFVDKNKGYLNCSTVSISIVYESNIVSTYREETNIQLFKRILKDIFAIGKLILTLMGLIIVYYQKKFLFKEETAWFDNDVRDAVLFHFNYHELDPADEEEKPPGFFGRKLLKIKSFFSKIISAIKYVACCCYLCRSKPVPKPPKILTRQEKIQKETKGSGCPIIRVFQGIPNQDKYSGSIGLINNIKWLLLAVAVIIYGVFVAIQDADNRLIILKLDNLDKLEIPEIQLNYTGREFWIEKYQEYLPFGQRKYCDINNTEPMYTEKCRSTNGFPNQTLTLNGNHLTNLEIKNDTIQLKENQYYGFIIESSVALWNFFPTFESVHITMNINGIEYYLRPFSNNTIHLEKNVYHYNNGTSITSYNPRIFQAQDEIFYFGKFGNYTYYYGNTTVNFFYSSSSIKHTFIEGKTDLGFRIVSDILAFLNPVKTFLTQFFAYLVIRFANKYSTAHVDPTIREAILYHMRYYEKYSKKFKKTGK